MLLVGAGQGLTFAPVTSAGIAGVTARDVAASGPLNTARQLGMALGLGILVAASASTPGAVAHVSTALTGSTGPAAVAFLVAYSSSPRQLITRGAGRRVTAGPPAADTRAGRSAARA